MDFIINGENVFGGLQKYGEHWQVIESRNFNADEISSVRSNSVVKDTNFRPVKKVCFFMKGGGQYYLPLSLHGDDVPLGSSIDMKTARLLKLYREGVGNVTWVEVGGVVDPAIVKKKYLDEETERLKTRIDELSKEKANQQKEYRQLQLQYEKLEERFKSEKAISLKTYFTTIMIALLIVGFLLFFR